MLATPWFLATQCACGFEALADEQVIDHILAIFEPPGAIGTDGKMHEEMVSRVCSCGIASISGDEMGAHFLAVFIPAHSVGRDGRRHEPVVA
jgi:triosephosphate isomerase